MADVEHVNRLISDYEQDTIRASIARTKKQLTDGLAERTTLRGQRTAFWVVAQTIYAATIDHIREFGTLKAIGATNGYIYRIILRQAAISAAIGYGAGIAIASTAAASSRNGGANILLPVPVRFALFGLTLLMCLGAAMVSINKVTKIDPAMVFKG